MEKVKRDFFKCLGAFSYLELFLPPYFFEKGKGSRGLSRLERKYSFCKGEGHVVLDSYTRMPLSIFENFTS